MSRRVRGIIAIALVTASCSRDGGVIGGAKLPGVPGRFVLEDDDRTVALTSVRHSLYYEIGDERTRVFHGAGGGPLRLSLLDPNTVLIRYCDGSIYEVASPFFDDPEPSDGNLRLLRLQVVTSPGLTTANGQTICKTKTG
jgi:hypothetical protein